MSSAGLELSVSSFLREADQFKLGRLATEKPHPLTLQLSQFAQKSPKKALNILHQVDCLAINKLLRRTQKILDLHTSIQSTLKSGGRIFLCGCGATGRLSLSLESFWRQENRYPQFKDRVIGLAAGGDTALIRSIEGFEDHPQWGAKQLKEAGFSRKDLCIAITEGGETPWVIGAVQAAEKISDRPPYFVYCNSDILLIKIAKRSSKVLTHPKINKLSLEVGPMALAGSTRMQASTVLMAGVGFPLLYALETKATVVKHIKNWAQATHHLTPGKLVPLCRKEAELYKKGGYSLYRAEAQTALTLLTDTTERAPTFSLHPFENTQDKHSHPALCYLYLPNCKSPQLAWKTLLHRPARCLEWPELQGKAGYRRLLGFDISTRALSNRRRHTPHLTEIHWNLGLDRVEVFWHDHIQYKSTQGHNKIVIQFNSPETQNLSRHLLLKMLLNMHSTCIMGRLHRYEGNLMTWVRPANKKLIDRAVRYAQILLKQKNCSQSYTELVRTLFKYLPDLKPDDSIVHKLVAHFLAHKKMVKKIPKN